MCLRLVGFPGGEYKWMLLETLMKIPPDEAASIDVKYSWEVDTTARVFLQRLAVRSGNFGQFHYGLYIYDDVDSKKDLTLSPWLTHS